MNTNQLKLIINAAEIAEFEIDDAKYDKRLSNEIQYIVVEV